MKTQNTLLTIALTVLALYMIYTFRDVIPGMNGFFAGLGFPLKETANMQDIARKAAMAAAGRPEYRGPAQDFEPSEDAWEAARALSQMYHRK